MLERHSTLRSLVAVGGAGLVLSLSLAACSSSTSPKAASSPSSTGSAAPTSAKKITLGVMTNDTTNPFLAAMDTALQTTAAQYGMKVDLLNGNLDYSTEIADVEDLIAKRVNMLIICPSSPTAILPAVRDANKAGIPVIDLNSTIAPGVKLVTYVGDSDYQYGVDEGKLTVQALHGKGNVAILLGVLGDSPEVLRLQGMMSVFNKYPGIKIVTKEVDNFANDLNLSDTQDLLSHYPAGTLNAIVAEGPEMYVGAEYAHRIGRTDVKFIAGDYSVQVKQAIQNGDLYGTVDQSPVLEGQLAAKYAYDWLTGKQSAVPTPDAYIALPMVTRANVAQYPAQWSG